MHRTKLLLTACVSAWVAYSCSQTGPNATSGTPAATGGSTDSSQSSSGGSQSSNNDQNKGGSDASSSEAKNEGGSEASSSSEEQGGSESAGGSSDSGGESGNGEGGSTSEDTTPAQGGSSTKTTTAKGGATAAGGKTGAGGTSAKTSATSATKGGSTSSAATGGTSSAATGGASAATTTGDLNIVPDMEGFYWEGSCMGSISASGKNCPFAPKASDASCPSGSNWDSRGAIREEVINVKGTTGTKYTINFEVRGVVGTRCYTGGTQASTATPSATGANNTWYVGGKQYKDSIWNTYEIHVDPPVSGEANVYYANAFSPSAGSNEEWCQKEGTYEVKYTAKFAVMGGGTIKFKIHDANCLAQQNCGSNDKDANCTSPRTVDLSGMAPAATFAQPPTNSAGGKTYYPQWLYFDVKSVTSP